MRRFIAGILAVAAVAALGFFAIAKAQRGGPDQVDSEQAAAADPGPYQNPMRPAAAESPPQKPAADPFMPREARSDPLVQTAGGQEAAGTKGRQELPPVPPPAPVMGPDPGAAHRLETASDPPGSREPPPFRADPPAAADPGPYRNPLRPDAAENPPQKPAADPFAMREVRADPVVRTASGQEATGLKGRDEFPPAPPAAPLPGPELGGTRRLDTASDPPGSREPAPFRADPAAAPAMTLLAPLPRNEVPPRNDAPLRSEATGQTRQDAFAAEVPPRADAADAAADGVGQPGDKRLEGPQTPQLTIQKLAPPEIQVGRPAVFRVKVRNTGTVPAANVRVSDQVPRGTRLLGSTPQASQGSHGELVWSLGALAPGQESTVEMQLLPTAEGEIGSVASVGFDAGASARSVSTRPRLVIETTGTGRVLVGDQATLTFVVSNPGTGVATGVVLEERVPAGLTHPAGGQLEYPIGDLRPGETRKLDLKMKAVRAGQTSNVVAARGDASLRCEHRFNLEVVAPQLDIALAGPKRRYLEREATYQVSVVNPGTAAAQQVELVAYLPPGLRFVGANNAGHYDEATRAVSWRLAELPTNQRGNVELVTLPVEAGQQNIKIRGTAARGLAVEKEQPVVVEGVAAVLFQVAGTRNPIDVGGETTYEVRVVNQGSKAAGNVRVALVLPPELKPLGAEGPTRYSIQNGQVVFEGLAQLPPKADALYRVRAQGLRPGDLRVRCQLLTDDLQTPVTKEESTQVCADE